MSGPPARICRVAVVGGGITGLAASLRLAECGPACGEPEAVVVLEADPRPGGQIRTERAGPYLLEAGPDSLVTQKPAALALCERLGLGDGVLRIPARPGTIQILRRGRLVPVPDGIVLMAPTRLWPAFRSPLFSPWGVVRMALEPFVPVGRQGDDESLGAFVRRRFGKEALDRLAEPVLAGLFTADPDRLSMRLALPRLLELERTHGSVSRALRAARQAGLGNHSGRPHAGAGGLVSLRCGMGSLIERLVSSLPRGTVQTGARVAAVERMAGGGGWRLTLAGPGPRTIEADAVLLACPSYAAAEAVAGLDRGLARDLEGLDYASCATVSLAYRRADVRRPSEGHGFFVPGAEGVPILACTYVSRKFPERAPQDAMLLRAFLGGTRDPDVLSRDDAALARQAHDALAPILGIEGAPVFTRVHRHALAMPQYAVGDTIRIDRIRGALGAHPGLFLAGSAVGAVGVPDCVRSGTVVAEQTIAYLDASRTERSAAAS